MKHINQVLQSTHFPGCWRYHDDCAKAEVERLMRQIASARNLIVSGDPDMTRRLIAIDRVLDPPKVGESI